MASDNCSTDWGEIIPLSHTICKTIDARWNKILNRQNYINLSHNKEESPYNLGVGSNFLRIVQK